MYRLAIFSVILAVLLTNNALIGERQAFAQDQNITNNYLYTQGNDALSVPMSDLASIQDQSDDPAYYMPSAYMAGTVAVQIILPESSDTDNRETWQPAQQETIHQAIDEALGWWAKQLPMAHLRFQSDLKVVPVSDEPISFGLDNEGRWIGEALEGLGFRQSNYFAQAFASLAQLRNELHTDWAITIFVVNSANDSDGSFSDGRFAYAYINGPFMVVTSDAGPYTAQHLAPVIAHEIGHLFGALDQYSAAQVPCTKRSGYLDVPTLNSRFGDCPLNLPSIMLDPISAYAAGAVDPSAQGQLGYQDSDNDGMLDVLATTPQLKMNAPNPSANGQQPVIRGRATDLAVPGVGGLMLTINQIERFEYRLSEGNWQLAVADVISADGSFELTLPVYDGSHDVTMRVVNSVGRTSAEVGFHTDVRGLGVMPTYTALAPTYVSNAPLPIQMSGPANELQLSLSPRFEGAVWQPASTQINAPLREDLAATQTVYVRFRNQNRNVSPVLIVSTTLDQTPPAGKARLLTNGELMLEASDNGSGVVEMQLRMEPQLLSEQWMPYQEQLLIPDGARVLGVRYRDRAGNVSPVLMPNALVALPLIVR